jgi:dihydroorotate dehydrogenase
VLKQKSFEIFEAVAKELFGKTTLISVGGIDSAEEVYRRIKAGASLVQIYSGLVFHGPDMIRDINLELINLIQADKYTNITQAIGADRK